MIVNPHLEGNTFFWAGGPVGVLLSHGLRATTAEVRLLGRILHEKGYTVAGPLLPGHNTTPDELNRTRWQDWTATMEQAYQQIASRCQRVFVGGESMGALVAICAASQHPEVAGILAYAPAMRLTTLPRLLLPLLAPFVPYMNPRRGPRPHVDAVWQGYSVQPTRGALQLLHLQREVSRRLPGIRQPILIVQGRLDATIDPRGAEELYRQIGSPVKELHWMENSTHCVALDQELPKVAELTTRFIARVIESAAETQRMQ